MIVKCFGCTTIHNKSLYKCLIHSFTKESFIYLGITIYKNIHKFARDNFNNILVKVKNDIQRWKNLKVSLQGRISTVKMNLLPQFIYFFSMLPLSPPPGYFKEIKSIISKFTWNNKCPRIKHTTLVKVKKSRSLLYCQFCHMYRTYIQRIEIALLSYSLVHTDNTKH